MVQQIFCAEHAFPRAVVFTLLRELQNAEPVSSVSHSYDILPEDTF
jgi:hypothetical protein